MKIKTGGRSCYKAPEPNSAKLMNTENLTAFNSKSQLRKQHKMYNKINLHKWIVSCLAFSLIFIVACSNDEEDLEAEGGDTSIQVPTAYSFDSRFKEGESSVAYSGQVVRNLLWQDLKIFTDSLGKSGATAASVADLNKFYDYKDSSNLQSLTTVGGGALVESYYTAISKGKNLKGKISKDPVIGYGKPADALMQDWFKIIADNSQDSSKVGTPAAYTDENGADLSQMINKVLVGAVHYYQSTGVYLNGILEQDNSKPYKDGSAYTAMEHKWDEAFGYFGAARDYLRYTDVNLAGKTAADFTFDSNGDGQIDFKSEYNFGLSRNAGKRDKGGSGVDFTKEIFQAFVTGRATISGEGDINQVAAQREIAAAGMEKVIAATVVHYINDTLDDMSKLGTADESKKNLNKHWSEMKGFTVALQYSPFKRVTVGNLQELHGIMGKGPSYNKPGTPAYKKTVANYNRAKAVLQTACGFSAANVAGW